MKTWLLALGDKSHKFPTAVENSKIFIGWGNLGDLRKYSSKDEILNSLEKNETNNALALWNFSHKMKIGDIVYIKGGATSVIGKCIIESDYTFDSNEEYCNIRKVEWVNTDKITIDHKITKTLTDMTNSSLFENIDFFEKKIYSDVNFFEDVYISLEK